MAKNVILCALAWLRDCKSAEEFLRQKRIPYVSKNIRADPATVDRLINKWKSRATAILVIDGEVTIGFNQP
ncbi:MAG: NrdH-redoxin [Deltaproteobacteria bacterium]|nr:NrdH-redoxin [Deltaproteobacteria bacterium]